MKNRLVLGVLFGGLLFGSAMATDLTIYYSPSCPHCHHARDFISTDLIYEYPDIKVTSVNVNDRKNLDEFRTTLEKCEYTSGGVPVIVIGEKCFQGFADSMRDDFRRALEVGMTETDIKKAGEIRKILAGDGAAEYRKSNANRQNAIMERATKNTQKKSADLTNVILYGVLGLLIVGLCAVLFGKKTK